MTRVQVPFSYKADGLVTYWANALTKDIHFKAAVESYIARTVYDELGLLRLNILDAITDLKQSGSSLADTYVAKGLNTALFILTNRQQELVVEDEPSDAETVSSATASESEVDPEGIRNSDKGSIQANIQGFSREDLRALGHEILKILLQETGHSLVKEFNDRATRFINDVVDRRDSLV